jgi:outer membrane protein OmpU
MNKLTKIGLTALASTLVAGSVSAADLSVTGGASITFGGGDDNATTGNGWSMGDSITFAASGDVNDIGVSLSYELDGKGAGHILDDHSVTFDLGDAGTLVFAGHGGSSALSAIDDKMPAAYEEPWAVVTGASAAVVNGDAENNMFKYSYSHESGLAFALAYHNAAAATSVESYKDFSLVYSGVDGLEVGYGAGTVHDTATESEESTMYATYAMGGMTVGIQTSEFDAENGSTTDRDTTGLGISYQVNDDLSVSYGQHTTEYNSGDDQEAAAIGIAYTMGSMSISGSYHSVDNIANTSTDDRTGYEVSVSFAF